MIFFTASLSNPEWIGKGHIGDTDLALAVNYGYEAIVKVQADGDELERCCAILGRRRPDNRVYTFIGDNAKEIAANWY
jgi:hypothetical protein